MAEIVDSMPGTPRGKHPWDEWFDGKARRMDKGVDFFNDPRHFSSQVRNAAQARGVSVRVCQRGDSLFVQAVRDDG